MNWYYYMKRLASLFAEVVSGIDVQSARAVPRGNPIEELKESLKPYISDSVPRYGIRMNDVRHIGINFSGGWNTPIGVCYYPLTNLIYSQAIDGKLPFRGEYPYMHLIEISGNVLYCQGYNSFAEDFEKLRQSSIKVHQCSESCSESNCPKLVSIESDVWKYEMSNEFRKLKSAMRWFGQFFNGSFGVVSAKMYRLLGYDVIVDLGGAEIHPYEPTQGIVFNPSALKIIDEFINPFRGDVAGRANYSPDEALNRVDLNEKELTVGHALSMMSDAELVAYLSDDAKLVDYLGYSDGGHSLYNWIRGNLSRIISAYKVTNADIDISCDAMRFILDDSRCQEVLINIIKGMKESASFIGKVSSLLRRTSVTDRDKVLQEVLRSAFIGGSVNVYSKMEPQVAYGQDVQSELVQQFVSNPGVWRDDAFYKMMTKRTRQRDDVQGIFVSKFIDAIDKVLTYLKLYGEIYMSLPAAAKDVPINLCINLFDMLTFETKQSAPVVEAVKRLYNYIENTPESDRFHNSMRFEGILKFYRF